MGLDVHAGFIKETDLYKPKQSKTTADGAVVDIADKIEDSQEYVYDNAELPYYWRKHARLQQFMMQLHDKRNGISIEERSMQGIMHSLNGYIKLQEEDILKLQQLVENDNLPFCPDSFFWGHQFQEETNKEYKEQDLDFCKDALIWLQQGCQVVYICSW
tara:strand:- start:81 stop:557 length:477 start_codon:yes stop_codon:yes gene_type:complete